MTNTNEGASRRLLCVIPCGITKIWKKYPNAGPTPARSAYTGCFHKMCQRYAIALYPDNWCILSAKHGFLFPGDIVESDYNVSFNKPSAETICIRQLQEQVDEHPFMKEAEIVVVVAGSAYAEIVKKVFPKTFLRTPLAGCSGNGVMMGLMKKAIDKTNSSELGSWM